MRKWILILTAALFFAICMAGCESGSAESSKNENSAGENSGKGSSAPVFDFESRTVTLNSGYEMPAAGLGTYALSDEECYNSVTALLEDGGRLIDTASYYGNEESVGRAIRDSDVPRKEIFVTTKIYPTEFDDPEGAIEACLERLDIGYIDLMLLHYPGDGDVEAYHALEEAVEDGKVHSIGLSNWYVEELEEFLPQVNITPAVGLGTYSLHGSICTNAVRTAIENGYRLIDTASFYGNEKEVGKGIKASGISREEIFVTTKLYPNQYGHAARAIDEALRKLDIGYIDLMLLHHPGAGEINAYREIEKAIDAGKIRSAGVSCYYIRETDAFLKNVSTPPALIQNEIHPYYQDTDVVRHIQSLSQKIVVQSWYPLGGRGYTGPMLNNRVIDEIAGRYGKSPAQVILRWDLQNGVAVIPGSSSPKHIRENISIFDFELTADEMKQIAKLNRNEKHDWY